MIEIYMIDFFLLQDGVTQIKSLNVNKKGKLIESMIKMFLEFVNLHRQTRNFN